MDFERQYKIDGLISTLAIAAAGVFAWASSIASPLHELGLDNTPARIGAIAGVSVLVAGWRLYRRYSRMDELLQVTPRELCNASREALGDPLSGLAEKAGLNGNASYVERNRDPMLLETIARHQVVAVIGPSGSGKSASARAAAEQLGRYTRVFIPRKPSSENDRPASETIFLLSKRFTWRGAGWLWLDDVGRTLHRDPFDMSLLRRWLDRHAERRVVITLASRDRDQLYREQSPAGDIARELRDTAGRHELEVKWEGPERDRAEIQYPRAGKACAYLARYLSSGDVHLHRFHDAEETCPEAAAILRAAVDWRRIQRTRAIPALFLREAFVHHLQRRPASDQADALFQAGIEWATDRRGDPEALLEHNTDPADTLDIADVAVEDAVERDRQTPFGIWQLLLDGARGTDEEVVIARIACTHGQAALGRNTLTDILQNQALPPHVQALARRAFDELITAEPISGARGSFGASRGEPPERRERILLAGAEPIRYSRLLAALYVRPGIWGAIRAGTLISIDTLALWGALVLGAFVNLGVANTDFTRAREVADHRVAYVVLFAVLLLARSGLYRSGGRGDPARVLAALTMGAVGLLALRIVRGPGIGPYGFIGLSFMFSCILVTGFRGAFLRISGWGANHARGRRRRIALVGTLTQVLTAAAVFREHRVRREVVGYIGPSAPPQEDWAPAWLAHGASVPELIDNIYVHDLDELILCDPFVTDDTAASIADSAWEAGARIRAVAPGRSFLVSVSRYIPGEPLPLENLRLPIFYGPELLVKRIFDVIVATTLLLVTLPLLVAISVAIRATSRGPAIQQLSYPGINRVGFGMRKFRINHVSPDERKLGPLTRVGRLIKIVGLDELPQLINVLKGDMSLVGPRPISQEDFDRLEDWQRNRSLVRPGITGLWQISGRVDSTFAPMVRLDFYYVQHWSLFLDIEILLKTLGATVMDRRAKITTPGAAQRPAPTILAERRASFGPALLAALPNRSLGFDDAMRLAGASDCEPAELLCWLTSLHEKDWLDIHIQDTRARFALSDTGRTYLRTDPRAIQS